MKVQPEFVVPVKNQSQIYIHLQILILGSRFFGLNNSRRNVIDWILILSVSLSYCGCCIVAIVNLDDIFSEHVTTILRIVESIQLVLGLFSMIISFFNSFNVNHCVTLCLEKLMKMDMEGSSLHSMARNKRSRQQLFAVIMQFSFYTILVLAVLLAHMLTNHEIAHYKVLFYTIRFFPLFCIGLNVLSFSNVILEAKNRLQEINLQIERYIHHQKSIPSRQIHVISAIYELAFELCKQMNTTFGVCNLIQIGYCFISITAKIFFIFITLNNLDEATIQDTSKSQEEVTLGS